MMQLCRGLSTSSRRLVASLPTRKGGSLISSGLSSRSLSTGHALRQGADVAQHTRQVAAAGGTVMHEVDNSSFNELASPRVTLTGNLGRDVEYKMLTGQKGPLELGSTSMAVNQDDGTTMWVNLKFWAEKAKPALEQLRKGMKVQVYGNLNQNVWTRAADQLLMTTIEVNVMNVKVVSRQQSSWSDSGASYRPTMGAGPQFVNEDQEYYEAQ